MMNEDKLTKFTLNVLVMATGSVAAIKVTELIDLIKGSDCASLIDVKLVATECAKHFLSSEEILERVMEFHTDEDEWKSWSKRGDPVLHIELRKWADVAIIAPLDANTLAKLAGGLCDNLLTCICRAWDFSKPILFAPAMNTFMWEHPVTSGQVKTLKDWGYVEVPCIEKVLMCKDKGLGAMAEPEAIFKAMQDLLKYRKII